MAQIGYIKFEISENKVFVNENKFYDLKLIFLHKPKLKFKKTGKGKLRK
jgi:hypothetical protein